MYLFKESLQYISSVTHDGKVLIFGTDAHGDMWYTVKRSGFEVITSTILNPTDPKTGDSFGFEDWQALPIADSQLDDSVITYEKENFTDTQGNYLLRSIYNKPDEVLKTAQAPLQVISAKEHLYVFRQNLQGKIVVNRFVLDGMQNKLVPKYEVRYRRSGKRLEPYASTVNQGGAVENFDTFDYKDEHGNFFYEPTVELSFINPAENGWFSVVLLPTQNPNQQRWHIFTCDKATEQVMLYSMRTSETGLFDIKDFLFVSKSGDKYAVEKEIITPLSGIIQRTFDLKGLKFVNHPAATLYNLQFEHNTEQGPQLMHGKAKLMFTVPVLEENKETPKTAAISFSIANDGTLAQIDLSPNDIEVLRTKNRNVLLPLDTLNKIQEMAGSVPLVPKTITETIRHGMRFDGQGDYLKTPPLNLAFPRKDTPFARTISAWIKIDALGNREQQIIDNNSEMLKLFVGADNKVVFSVSFSNNSVHTIIDSQPLPTNTWIHYAGVFTYELDNGGQTRMTLTRNGEAVPPTSQAANEQISGSEKIVLHDTPFHLGDELYQFDGQNYIDLPDINPDFSMGLTLECWLYRAKSTYSQVVQFFNQTTNNNFSIVFNGDFIYFSANLSENHQEQVELNKWVHVAFTVDANRNFKCYINGSKTQEKVINNPIASGNFTFNGIGGNNIPNYISAPFQGKIAEVRLWNISRSAEDIQTYHLQTLQGSEPNLVGYWPLNGSTDDLSFPKYNGTIINTLSTQKASYCYPMLKAPKYLHFDGINDYVEVSTYTNSAQSLTVSLWAKSDTDLWSSSGSLLSKKGSFSLSPKSQSRTISFRIYTTAWHEIEATLDSITTWHHYAAVYDGSTLYLYVDGKEMASTAVTGDIQALPDTLAIARDEETTTDYFGGCIAEVCIYDHAKTAIQIQTDMYYYLTPNKHGLVAYWPLTENVENYAIVKKHGLIHGNPIFEKYSYLIGGDKQDATNFIGEISEVQIWNRGLSVSEIKNNLSLRLSGKEADLAAYYRMGAIVDDITVPDFSVHQKHALLYGNPYAGFRSLYRATQSGQKVHNYSTAELFAVEQKITYEESFEFRLRYTNSSPTDGPSLNPPSTPPIQEGLLACLIGENLESTTWQDLSESHHHATPDTLETMPSPFTIDNHNGKQFKVARFNPDKALAFPDTLTLNGPFSIFIVDSYFGATQGRNLQSPNTNWLLGKVGGNNGCYMGSWIGSSTKVNDIGIFDLNVATFENGEATWYLNSVEKGNLSGATAPGRLILGKGVYKQDSEVDVACLLIYNRVLSENERQQVEWWLHQRYGLVGNFVQPASTVTPTIDVNNADGSGNPLFRFAYRGKSSRNTAWQNISTNYYVQNEFKNLNNGWYKAVCRFTVPEKIALMRTFEIVDIKGKWGSEALPPADEWLAMDIRQHKIYNISDKISRETYMDEITLPLLTDANGSSEDRLEEIKLTEEAITRTISDIHNLEERIKAAQNQQATLDELEQLQTEVASLETLNQNLQTEILNIQNNPLSYYLTFINKKYAKYLTVHQNLVIVAAYGGEISENDQMYEMVESGDGIHYYLLSKSGKYIGSSGFANNLMYSTIQEDKPIYKWKIPSVSTYGPIWCKAGLSPEADINNTPKVINSFNYGYARHVWQPQKTTIMTATKENEIATHQAKIEENEQFILQKNSRILQLQAVIGDTDINVLQTQLTTLQTKLSDLSTTFATHNTAFLNGLAAYVPLTMTLLKKDRRELSTRGAVLDFVRPHGAVNISATSQGFVELSYFDNKGRMRLTPYDAVADSRDTTFQQWLPEVARACVDCAESEDKIVLNQAINLEQNAWSVESWVYFPGPLQADARPFAYNRLLSSQNGKDSPLVIKDGSRLGTLVDGFFHDSGLDLKNHLKPGWHHLAAVARNNSTEFYIDGQLNATLQPSFALQFNGQDSYLEIPAFSNPTTAITVALWAKSDTETWNADGCLISKRDAFVMHPESGSRVIKFYVHTGSWTAVEFDCPDIQNWHHYVGTYNGQYVCFYIDGVLVAETALTGPITESSGIMTIGMDDYQTVKHYFQGQIFDVSIWETAKNVLDIKNMMYHTFTGQEGGLVAYWEMKFSSGTVADISTQHDGLIKGSVESIMFLPQCQDNIYVLGNAPTGGSPAGKLAEIRFWNLALSDKEVYANAHTLLIGYEPGLIAYWPLKEATGIETRDHSGNSNHATLSGADWAACTAQIGHIDVIFNNVMQFNGQDAYLEIPYTATLNPPQLTIEAWVKVEGGEGTQRTVVSSHEASTHQGYIIYASSRDTWQFWLGSEDQWNTIDGPDIVFQQWTHLAGVYDGSTMQFYVNGVLVHTNENTLKPNISLKPNLSRPLQIGCSTPEQTPTAFFNGLITEVRLYQTARTETDIQRTMFHRLSGSEIALLGYWPLNSLDQSNPEQKNAQDLTINKNHGLVYGDIMAVKNKAALSNHLVTAEYSITETNNAGEKDVILKKFLGYVLAEKAYLIPEKRVEKLVRQWINNIELQASLVGYIEGPPPIPSENFIKQGNSDAGYDGATSVTLVESSSQEYTWERSETIGENRPFQIGFGLGSGISLGVALANAEGDISTKKNAIFNKNNHDTKSSEVSAALTASKSISVSLNCISETEAQFPHLGKRYLPKNVGYALLSPSQMAEMYIIKLARSGRMISYDIVPLALGKLTHFNIVPFFINPAYVMNGTLDGMVGSSAANSTLYSHVSEVRAQHGSSYPASYYRLQEAAKIKNSIQKGTIDYKALYDNHVAPIGSQNLLTQSQNILRDGSSSLINLRNTLSFKSLLPKDEEEDGGLLSTISAIADMAKMFIAPVALSSALITIVSQGLSMAEQIIGIVNELPKIMLGAETEAHKQALDALEAWQEKMLTLREQATRGNIVNSYSWDADGGFRIEEHSFATSIKHYFIQDSGTENNQVGGIDTSINAILAAEVAMDKIKEFSLVASAASGKQATLDLQVDISGLESGDITDLNGVPLKPGEKVKSYRFITTYEEGEEQHFQALFNQVIDPEWLESNDESALVLRQIKDKLVQKPWRVRHIVTDVERPGLAGEVGITTLDPADEETDEATNEVVNYFRELDGKQRIFEAQLSEILTILKK